MTTIRNWLGTVAVVASCQTSSGSQVQTTSEKPPEVAEEIDCGTSEYVGIIMEPLARTIENSYAPSEQAPNIQLDGCLDGDDNLTIVQGVYLSKRQSAPAPVQPTGKVKGIMKALSDGDHSKVSAKLGSGNIGFVLTSGTQDDFVEMRKLLKDKPYGNPMVGRLTLGTLRGECPLGQVAISNSIQAGSAKITYDRCAWGFGLGSGTAYYSYRKVTVTDASENLDPSIRNKAFSLDKAVLADESNFRFQQNHHNSCDAMVIYLPHATYALTGEQTFTIGSGCTGFHEAPERAEADVSTRREKSAFKIIYASGSKTDTGHIEAWPFGLASIPN